MARAQFAVTLMVVVLAVVLGGCSRGPSGLIDHKVCGKRAIAHGRLLEVRVVVSPTATEEEVTALDDYLADKYDVRPGGKGQTIFYVDSQDAAAQYLAIHDVPEGFQYIPPGDR